MNYDIQRKELVRQYPGDAQGFYYADYKLRKKYGMKLHDDHEQAIKAQNDRLMGDKNWREEKPF